VALVWQAGLAAHAALPTIPNAFYAMDTSFQRPGLDEAGQFQLVHELGFAGIAWHETLPAAAAATAERAEAAGLRMTTIYCAAQVTPEGDVTPAADLAALMDALKPHGTLIWLHFSGQGPAITSLSPGHPVIRKLRSFADAAAARGLKIAIYPHLGEWTEKFGDATRVARLVNHPAFGVTFNLCHCLAAGDETRIPALLTDAGPLLLTVTLSGADSGLRGGNWSRLIQTLDHGTYDPMIVLRQLRRIGFTGPIGFQGYAIPGSARSILEPTIARWHELAAAENAAPVRLFDGATFKGWEGDTNHTWRIENGAFVGGSLTANVPRNEFLCTTRPYTNFILRLQFKLAGKSGFINGGVQFRSRRVQNPPNEMAGYQADIGDPDYWGSIYDEGIRNKTLAKPDMEALNRVLKRADWNDYVIRAEGPRVQLWINGVQTVDYTEPEPDRVQWGWVGLQIHGGAVAEASYRGITIEELP